MKQKRNTPRLRVVWESIPDAEYLDQLRKALEIILEDEDCQKVTRPVDENCFLNQYEPEATEQSSRDQGRATDAH